MTNIVVKSCTVLYMCVEIMICQCERLPERLMISQTPSMGRHQITSGGRRNMEETFPAFGMSFAKVSCSKQDIPNLPKFGILDLLHVCICQYDKSGSE